MLHDKYIRTTSPDVEVENKLLNLVTSSSCPDEATETVQQPEIEDQPSLNISTDDKIYKAVKTNSADVTGCDLKKPLAQTRLYLLLKF